MNYRDNGDRFLEGQHMCPRYEPVFGHRGLPRPVDGVRVSLRHKILESGRVGLLAVAKSLHDHFAGKGRRVPPFPQHKGPVTLFLPKCSFGDAFEKLLLVVQGLCRTPLPLVEVEAHPFRGDGDADGG